MVGKEPGREDPSPLGDCEPDDWDLRLAMMGQVECVAVPMALFIPKTV